MAMRRISLQTITKLLSFFLYGLFKITKRANKTDVNVKIGKANIGSFVNTPIIIV